MNSTVRWVLVFAMMMFAADAFAKTKHHHAKAKHGKHSHKHSRKKHARIAHKKKRSKVASHTTHHKKPASEVVVYDSSKGGRAPASVATTAGPSMFQIPPPTEFTR